MAKRYGRTLVTPSAARNYRFAQLIRGSDHADMAGNCQTPITVQLTGLQDGRLHRSLELMRDVRETPFLDYADGSIISGGRRVKLSHEGPRPIHVDVAVRCRKCPKCLQARAAHWRIRAMQECSQAPRTWFGTMTLDPAEQFKALSRARLRLAQHGDDFDALPAEAQFAKRTAEVGPEVQKWLKRLRKNSGASFRYLIVVEAHKSGLPHWHCLIHELSVPLRHRVLQSTWRLGFSSWKLVHDNRHAAYVCKYLSKSSLARVRASKTYGNVLRDHPFRPGRGEGETDKIVF